MQMADRAWANCEKQSFDCALKILHTIADLCFFLLARARAAVAKKVAPKKAPKKVAKAAKRAAPKKVAKKGGKKR